MRVTSVKSKRRGASAVQLVLVAAAVVVTAAVSMWSLGDATSDDMDRTADNFGDPSSLVDRFGSHHGGETAGAEGDPTGGGY